MVGVWWAPELQISGAKRHVRRKQIFKRHLGFTDSNPRDAHVGTKDWSVGAAEWKSSSLKLKFS